MITEPAEVNLDKWVMVSHRVAGLPIGIALVFVKRDSDIGRELIPWIERRNRAYAVMNRIKVLNDESNRNI